MAAGGLADLGTSLEQGLGLPVSHPTLEILLNEQADLKVSPVLHTQVPHASSCIASPPLYPTHLMYMHTNHALLFVTFCSYSQSCTCWACVHLRLCYWAWLCHNQGTRSQVHMLPLQLMCIHHLCKRNIDRSVSTLVIALTPKGVIFLFLSILASCLVSMQATLQEAHDQNERLRLTVSAMRSDMESMHHHTTSPGQPHQSPLPPLSTPFTSPRQQPQPQSVMHSQLPSQLQHQAYQQLPSVSAMGMSAAGSQWSAAQAGSDASAQQRQQEEEVQSLRQQLQDAKCEAQDLAAENERLMELSNALRSERDRAGLIQNSPAFCPQQQQLVAHSNVGNQGSVQQPLVNLTPACMSQSHAHHPVQQGLSGFPQVPQSQTLQAYVMQQPYQAMPLAAHSVMLGQGQGSFDQPLMQSTLMQPHESSQYVAQQSTGQCAIPQGQQQPKGPTQPGADDSLPSEVMSICLENLNGQIAQQH